MNKVLSTLANILKYAPLVTNAVQSVETDLKGVADSKSKAATAIAAVLAAAHVGETIPVGAVQLVSSLVDITVSTLNATGVFTKPSNSASTVTPPAS